MLRRFIGIITNLTQLIVNDLLRVQHGPAFDPTLDKKPHEELYPWRGMVIPDKARARVIRLSLGHE